MFENLNRWLNGVFICSKCDRELHTTYFGYGETICSNCYNGETSFIFLDNTFWLNKMLTRLFHTRALQLKNVVLEPNRADPVSSMPELEIIDHP